MRPRRIEKMMGNGSVRRGVTGNLESATRISRQQRDFEREVDVVNSLVPED